MEIKAPLISVSIPHLNQPEELGYCVASQEAQSLDRSLFEIIVVDNGSSSMPEAVVSNHAGVQSS